MPARPGAGRKKGGQNKKTREIADRAAAEGITPIEVMLRTMRKRWDAEDEPGALEAAQMAAPYVHPRLSTVDAKHSGSLDVAGIDRAKPVTREEWLANRRAEMLALAQPQGTAD
jgi:hypothetical protein